ncbi:hypothetical protein [Vibrio harveyi]|uniref:hypothetical protein n=1 Tax=Vibrio harveyi TaxID=669 RepID=UPI003CF5A554
MNNSDHQDTKITERFIEMLKRLLSFFLLSNNGGSGITSKDLDNYERKIEDLTFSLEKLEEKFIKEGDPQSALFCRLKIEAYENTLDIIKSTNSVNLSTVDLDQYAAIAANTYQNSLTQCTQILDSDSDEDIERKMALQESRHDYEGLDPKSLQEKLDNINEFCGSALKGDKIAAHVEGITNEVDKIGFNYINRLPSPAVENGVESYAEPVKDTSKHRDQETSRDRLQKAYDSLER